MKLAPATPTGRSHGRRLERNMYENDDLEYIGYTGSYINRREVTLYLRITSGKYIIVPSIYEVMIDMTS